MIASTRAGRRVRRKRALDSDTSTARQSYEGGWAAVGRQRSRLPGNSCHFFPCDAYASQQLAKITRLMELGHDLFFLRFAYYTLVGVEHLIRFLIRVRRL